MKHYFKLFIATALIHVLSQPLHAANKQGQERSPWYFAPVIGISQLSDLTATADNVFGSTGDAEVGIDSGFIAGIAAGYQYDQNWSGELGWEYRTNDSAVMLPNGTLFSEGNYASNSFSLTGKYAFANQRNWQPFVGLGLVWLQEIDVDLETDGQEFSYSSNSDIGFQLLGGINYQLSDSVELEGALRYSSIQDIELKPEAGGDTQGAFADIDYQPLSFQLALKYRF